MIRAELRQILVAHGKLNASAASLSDDGDLFDCGMDSLAVVDVMLAIEQRFGIEFPDALLTRRSFSSVASLEAAVRSVTHPVAG